MNLVKWNKLYDNNLRLDKIFIDKYGNDKEFYKKNRIELLVEIGEFINETKVFKYWSIKKRDNKKVLEECADVITMILSFYGVHKLEIKEFNLELNDKVLDKIIDLYNEASLYSKNNNINNISNIFKIVLEILYSLGYQEEDILEAINNKQLVIEERLNSEY